MHLVQHTLPYFLASPTRLGMPGHTDGGGCTGKTLHSDALLVALAPMVGWGVCWSFPTVALVGCGLNLGSSAVALAIPFAGFGTVVVGESSLEVATGM